MRTFLAKILSGPPSDDHQFGGHRGPALRHRARSSLYSARAPIGLRESLFVQDQVGNIAVPRRYVWLVRGLCRSWAHWPGPDSVCQRSSAFRRGG